jgi:hypothetical protein
MSGGTRFGEAASADDLRTLSSGSGSGAPTQLASGVMFEPLYVSSTLVGNSEADDVTDDGESPTQLFVRYLGHGSQVVTSRVDYVRGASVHYYLKKTHTVALRSRHALMVGGKRVRMSYVPKEGEHITLAPPRAPHLQFGGS